MKKILHLFSVITAIAMMALCPAKAWAAVPDVASVTINGTATNYNSLIDAMDAAMNAESATLKLLANVNTYDVYGSDNCLDFNKGNVTLDLNGHTVTAYFYATIKASGTATLTVTDTSEGATGKVTNTSGDGIWSYGSNATLIIYKGTFESTGSSAYGIQTYNSGHAVLYGGRYIGNCGAAFLPGSSSSLAEGYGYTDTNTGTILADSYQHPIFEANSYNLAKDITVVAVPPVACVTINGTATNYFNVINAMNAAMNAESATLKLLADINTFNVYSYNNCLNFNKGNVTLDLNGHTVTANFNTAIQVSGTATLTVTDTSEGATGKVFNNGSDGINVDGSNATLIIYKGTFEATGARYGIITQNSGHAVLYGGHYIGNNGAAFLPGSSSSLAEGYAFSDTQTGTILEDSYENPIFEINSSNFAKDITVVAAPVVASVTINGTATNYNNLFTAMKAAMNAESATLKLLADVNTNKVFGKDYWLEFSKGNVTLDLNGHTIKANYTMAVRVWSLETTKLTVTDTSEGATGKVTNTQGHGICAFSNYVTLVIHKGTFETTGDTKYGINNYDAHTVLYGGRYIGTAGGVFISGSSSALAAGYVYTDTQTGDILEDSYSHPIFKANSNTDFAKDITIVPFAYPTVNLNASGFATYSSAKAFDIATEGVKAYIAEVDGQAGTITLSEVEGAVPAGQGVLLYGGASKAGTTVEFQAPSADPTTDFTNNDLKPTTTATENIVAKPSSLTVWALGTDNMFYVYTGNSFIANRAFLIYGSIAAKAMRMIFADNDATAINAVSADKANVTVKCIENGRIVIKKNGVKYNVSGQMMK